MSFPSGANPSRCSASCDVSLSPLLPLLCHRSSLTHLHWGQDTLSPVTGSSQHGIRSCLLSSPLLWLFARGAEGAGRDRTMFQPSAGEKGLWHEAGEFSVPYQQRNEDTACGNIFHWKTIPGDATSSRCQGPEHSPRAPQLGQGPRQLCWPLPDSVGQVKPGQVKPEEMLKLSHVG